VEDVEVPALQRLADRLERRGAQRHHLDRGAPAVGPQARLDAHDLGSGIDCWGAVRGGDREEDAKGRGTARSGLAGLHLSAADDGPPLVERHELEPIRIAQQLPGQSVGPALEAQHDPHAEA
jgi:hypothetical protein